MPAIGDMNGIWQSLGRSLAKSTTAIARHDLDARMSRQPSLNSRCLSVGQQRYNPSSLQIAYDRAIPMVSPERPVIDADNNQKIGGHRRSSTHDA